MAGIKVGEKEAILFRGDHAPIRICKGSQQISGWEEGSASGQSITLGNTYNDAAHVEILGNAELSSAPSAGESIEIIPASGTLTTSCEGKESSQTIPALYGIKNDDGTWASRDKLVIDDATESAWIERNVPPHANEVQQLIQLYGMEDALRRFIGDDPDDLTESVDAFFTAAAESIDATYASEFFKYSTNTSPDGEKQGDNAGLSCVPSTISTAGQDDYAALPLFACFDLNYTIDETTLEPVIHAIRDIYGEYTAQPTDSLVGVMQMTGWVRRTSTDTKKKVEYRAKRAEGFYPLPEGVRTDGTVRGFVIHAKYAAGYNAAGKLSSVSGVQPASYRPGSAGSTPISHNGQITKWREWGNQYSGSSLCDMAFLQLMLEIKYAKLGNAGVMAGCRNYYQAYTAAVSENGVSRIVLPASQANAFVVGSRVSIGSKPNRDQASCYDVHDIATITSIEDVTIDGTAYKAVSIDTETLFNTTAAMTYITPQPWATGSTDGVQGNDGSPTSNTSGKEPFKIQGIEVMLGIDEALGSVKVCQDTQKYTVYATRLAADIVSSSTVNDNYITVGTIPKETAGGWKYNAELNWNGNNQDDYMIPTRLDGSSSTGYRSATYLNSAETTGWDSWFVFGLLDYGGICGLSCSYLGSGLGNYSWFVGARACGSGGNRGEYTGYTPTIEPIDYTAVKTFYPQTVMELTSNLPMEMSVQYKHF